MGKKLSQAKHTETLPNGRNRKKVPSFENWFCRIFPKDMTYPAWRCLSKTATDVANICRAKSDHAAATGKKGDNGRPVFEFTATEAEKNFHIPRPTFSKAIHQLIKIGFLEVIRPGGTLDGKGIPAQYRLLETWKSLIPPPRDNTNIMKARSSRKTRKDG